ncbi:MAG: LytR family transcriptional regulator [Thermobacillus sp. ZCTH02-B1]|uniref:LytTR family transcriptional regulator DNA-binding domain-containing protein n=1 Tax=Thermobacillus sp. ZCTH02-B1 TaxID=1858795 RepID=UPI000B551A7E|nr:LytTR family transcriptional regulator DNA-binding domain-containing protein [Thermobacillus sp. ZCTH02-B1]OUM93853.1 MAG: LytR family transcriptional regulator [Thermobacillus sp. ZCTH02-B1]
MRFPVTRDPGNFTEVIELDLSDVDFIETHSSGYVVFHRGDEIFYPLIPKLSVLETHLERFGFLRLDRTNLSNLGKIRRFDEERLLVFFSDTVTKSSKYSTVSTRMKRTLKERLAFRNGQR